MSDKKLVYIIDDDAGLLAAYSAAVTKLGYQVATASDGIKALALVKAAKPDLMLLDLLMPNMDGIGMLKEIRKDKNNQDIKVITVSNFEQHQEGAGLGVVKHITKMNSGPDEVAATVDAVIRQGA
ncbi:MAG TPA: response regulator [Candidatus Dormibacteraeota bacterium]|nr:response regulator [Candidatus Dormibacteraeota bacterium]